LIQVIAALLLAQAPATEAPRVKLSGYVQPQYEVRTTNDRTTDRTLFRRLVFSADVEPIKHWRGQFQVDAAPLVTSGDRPVIKNAYLQYTGWADRGLTFTVGNQKMPLSRGLLRSSSRRGQIERLFTEDRAYGSPGRALSVKLEGSHRHKRVYWMGTVGESRQSTDPNEIRIDGSAELGNNGNQGVIAGGRVEVHPLGETPRDEGDLGHGPLRFSIAAGTYGWWNDHDVLPHAGTIVDASRVTGTEVSGALRGGGWSLDVEYDRITAATEISGLSTGLYRDGRARLHKTSIEGGYTLLPHRLEALLAVDALDSLTFDTTWRRVSGGINWYIKDHDVKVSIIQRESFDERGVRGTRSHATFLQTQLVF
jgi:hypothetical protein